MTSGFKNGMRDLVNFHTSGQNFNSSVVFSERKVVFGQSSSSTFNFLDFALLVLSCSNSLCDF